MSAVRGLYKLGAAALVAIQAACVSVPTKPDEPAAPGAGGTTGTAPAAPAEPSWLERKAAEAAAAAREMAARAEAGIRGGADSAASSVGLGKKPEVAALENGRIPAAAKGKTGLFVSNPAHVKALTEDDPALAKAVIDGAKTGQDQTLPAKPGTAAGLFGRLAGAVSQSGARVYGVAYGRPTPVDPKKPNDCVVVPTQVFEGVQRGINTAPLMNAQPTVTGLVQSCPIPGVTQTPTGVRVDARTPTAQPSIFKPQ